MKFSEFNVAVNTSQIDFIVGYKGLQNFRISPSDLVGTFSSLNYITDSGSGTIDLGTQAFSILGTANEIETSGALQTLTIGFPASGVTLPDGSVATTQTIGDNSDKVATTAYVDASITAEDLDFSGDTGTGSVDLDSQILNIIGTTNEIETAASGQTLTIGLPDDVSITGELTVLGIGQSSFAGQLTIPLTPVATTDAASKGYVDSKITAEDLDFAGDTGTGAVDLDSQIFTVAGTINEIETSASGQTLTIGLPDDVTIAGELTVSGTGQNSFGGQVTIPATPIAGTDAASKSYVDAKITAEDLDFTGDSGSGSVDLDSQSFSVTGGAVITTTASGQNLDIVHDNISRTDSSSSDAPSFGGTFTAVDSVSSSSQGHITAINVKTVTLPTPTYPTVNNNTITIDAGSNLNGGGDFTLNQSFDETITVNLDTTITGLTSVTSTTFAGQLNGSISSATTATTQAPNDNSTKVATTAYVDTSAGNYLPLAGGTMSGSIAMGGNNISGGGTATFTTFVGALQGNADTASALAASGNITLTGDTTSTGGPYTYTSGGNVAIATTIADTTVTGKVLTGVNLGTSQTIAATDTILEAFGYLQAQITQLPQGLVYQGTWNASTNTPTLTSGSGTTGHFYIVSVAGNTNLDGITDWQVGDWAIFVEAGGTDTWQKIDNTSAITGTGATNKLAKWTGPTTLSTGLVEDDGTTVTIGNSGDLDVTGSADITGDLAWSTSLTDTTNTITITKFVDEADGITANDNDTSIPTSAAVKDYVDTQIGTVDTLAEVLSNGNTTGGTDISVSSGDDITFAANSKTIFNSALQIYNTGTQSVIYANTNNLLIESTTYATVQALSDIYLKPNGGNNGITITGGGAVTLYHNNAQKLATTSTGLTVTGRISNLTDPTLAQDAATKNYVDTQLGGQDTLAEILANGNTTGGTDIAVSSGDDITFADDSKVIFGASSDLQIYHNTFDGANEGLISNSTNNLKLVNTADNSNIILQTDDGSGSITNYLIANGFSGAVELYHYGSKKFETTSTGGKVTGDLYVTGAFLDSNNSSGTADQVLVSTGTGTDWQDLSDISGVDGSGTANTVAMWSDTDTITDAPITISGNNATFAGSIVTQDDSSIFGGSGTVPLYLRSTGTVSYAQFQTSSTGNNGTNDGLSVGVNGTTAYVWQREDASLYLGTNNTLAVTIDNSQNVGIGTTSPSTGIEIGNGGLGLPATTGTDNSTSFMRLKKSTSGWGVDYGLNTQGTPAGWIQARDTTNFAINAAFLINPNGGNVGIGATDPVKTLDVRGQLAISNNASSYWYIDRNGDGYFQIIDDLDNPALTIDTSRNVGIGYASPSSFNQRVNAPHLVVGSGSNSAGVTIFSGTSNQGSINFADGTTTTDQYTGGIVYVHGSDNYMSFHTNGGTERMRIDSSGRVGIGANSPSAKLDVRNDDGVGNGLHVISDFSRAGGADAQLILGYFANGSAVTGPVIYAANSMPLLFSAGATERMRISSLGRVEIGTREFVGSATSTTRLYLEGNASGHNLGQFQMADFSAGFQFYLSSSTASQRQSHQFYNGRIDASPTQVGSIQINSTSTAFNTSSDYRLKENVVEMTGALDRVSQLKPSRFNFIGHEEIVDGFLAHEVQDIVPEAITGTKDEMRTEEYEETPAVYEEVIHEAQEAIEWTDKPTINNTKVEIQTWLDDNSIDWQSADTKQELLDRIPEYQQEAQEEWTESVLVSEAVMATREVPVYQGIDQSKLVPLLVGAIQELKAEIETLKSK